MFEDFTFTSGGWSSWPIVDERTPVDQLEFIHKKIWNYVIEHGEKPDTPYLNNCVACDSAKHVDFGVAIIVCCQCPIKWPDEAICRCSWSLYNRWRQSDGEVSIELAKQIRDVDWRKPCSTP